jgi:hypothetical protein
MLRAMDELWRRTLLRKYGNLIDLLESCLRDCPPELWETSIWPVTKDQPWVWPIKRFGEKAYPDEAAQLALLPTISAYWNVAYHVIFHVDFYLSGGGLPYRPPTPFREEEHRPYTVPAHVYAPEELLVYLEHCRGKATEIIGGLTDEEADAITPRNGGTRLDLLMHNLVHAHEHAGQFELFLGQHGMVPSSSSPARRLRHGVIHRTDREVDAFVASIGGYARLLPQVFAGFAAGIGPSPVEGTLRWEVGTPFALRVGEKGAKVEKTPPVAAGVTIRLSPQDFLRLMTRGLPFQAAARDGRIRIEGDAALLATALGGRAQP